MGTEKMKRLYLNVLSGFIFLTVIYSSVNGAEPKLTPKELKERGVLFYVPFEDSTDAMYAFGEPKPRVARDMLYTAGVKGKAVQMFSKKSRYVMMPWKRQQKYKNGQSILVYEGKGNINGKRGTMAFWVLSPFEGTDETLLTGSGMSGPFIVGISAKGVYQAFFSMCRRKSYFDCVFGGNKISGKLKRFGTLGTKMVPLWKKDYWHHVAVTWDEKKGYAIYLDGKLIDKFEGDIDWKLLKPDTLSLGNRPLRAGDLWPVRQDYVFDELLFFDRPLSYEEIMKVKNCQYTELKKTSSLTSPFDTKDKRKDLEFDISNNRPVFIASDKNLIHASIKKVGVEDVKMNFHKRYTLVDNDSNSKVKFNDGNVPFNIPAVFIFTEKIPINHIVSEIEVSNGSYVFSEDKQQKIKEIPKGKIHSSIPSADRKDIGIYFKGDSSVREVSFYNVNTKPGTEFKGDTFYVSQLIGIDTYPDVKDIILNNYHPQNLPAMYALKNPAKEVKVFQRKEMRNSYIVLQSTNQERYVNGLELKLKIKADKKKCNAVVKIYSPYKDDSAVFDMDMTFEFQNTNTFSTIDLVIYPPGLIIPKEKHLLIELIFDANCEIEYGGSSGSSVTLQTGDPIRVGNEFALSQLRKTWFGYLRRFNQNRFMLRGENKVSNPIYRRLALAKKYAPNNQQVKKWMYWARFNPWPKHDFSSLKKQHSNAPEWAIFLREGLGSMRDIIHWWLKNRSNEDCYLVGGGNQWNDITKLYNKFLALGAMGDKKLINAIQKYLDAHWNSGRMKGGYCVFMTDILHSAEEATFIQPAMNILNPGKPRNVGRDLLFTSNYPKWIQKNSYGHTHFVSNFITTSRKILGGSQGQDLCKCESVVVPGFYLTWYNGYTPTANIIKAYLDSWLEDTLRKGKEKPAGIIPASVQFATDKLINKYAYRGLMYSAFLWGYYLTGDDKYLQPIRLLLKEKEKIGGLKWAIRFSSNFLEYRLMTNNKTFDKTLDSIAETRFQAFKENKFSPRGLESAEAQVALRWLIDRNDDDLMKMLEFVINSNKNAFYLYCQTDPPTDRVYPAGRVILPLIMLGGRLFDSRACDPAPTAAFVWDGIGSDIVSMVFDRNRDTLKMLVYNFNEKPVKAGIKALDLPEGQYTLVTAFDSNNDRKPDGKPESRQITLRRFTPALLKIPPQKVMWIELKLLKKRPTKLRPDLSPVLASLPDIKNKKVVARIYNLGCVPSGKTTIQLRLKDKKLSEETVNTISGIKDYKAMFSDVALKIPDNVDISQCEIVVDPDNTIDEINESNNSYKVLLGIPPSIEK